MSNPLKGLGKVFRKVAKVVKKFALPALAIAAVVFTGGAAIGALPALGSVLGAGGLGLSPALVSIASTAATGATVGAVGGAITGKGILKGATAGLVGGAVAGGLGQVAGAIGSGAKTIAGSVGTDTLAGTAGTDTLSSSGITGMGPAAATQAAAPAAAPVAAQAASGFPAQAAHTAGGIGGWLERNQMLAGTALQGLGSGLSSMADAKERRKQDERERRSYDVDPGSYFRLSGDGGNNALQPAEDRYSPQVYGGGAYEYDPSSGRISRRKDRAA